ncbi:Uncharacterised protein [uncultured Clostridium sp.]|uniref:Uncharacterized protein n=1 Tax=Flintibacter hominis TaxID=2763048 RepID=A0A8J6M7Y0_9FIRM|nr:MULTISPECIES: hypothetical protein [Eubacteriales]MBC5722167.1 hypothetical protein [Flintibacter hominis]MCU6701482.1 hypothetical protein [Muriventricola aceti]SCH43943.1 Uncharacterised protein [uncultured Clostridium sp.]SCI62149.1 Uncharacterised protein [uncultured Flavonifractor sp.]
MIKMICLIGGNILRKELYDYHAVNIAVSSFSERRTAIDLELIVLRRFSDIESGNEEFLCKGRKLITMDGVNFNTAHNKNMPSFMSAPNTIKGG